MNEPVNAVATKPATKRGWFRRGLGLVGRHPILVGIAAVIALPFLFYAEEDWRGKHAWEHCKEQIRAKGRTLDWTNFIPMEVKGDDNFFAAPYMAGWFSGRGGNDLTFRLGMNNFYSFLETHRSNYLADVVVVPVHSIIPAGDADLVLKFESPLFSLASTGENPDAPTLAEEVCPLIVMDEVPLSDAIKNLARQKGINYILDSRILYGNPGPDGVPLPQPLISARWTNITIEHAFTAVLKNYNLQYVPDAKTGVGRIVKVDPSQSVMDQNAREPLAKAVQDAIAGATNGVRGTSTLSAQYFTLRSEALNPMKPVRIFVRSDTTLTMATVEDLFRSPGVLPEGRYGNRIQPQVKFASSNSFHVSLGEQINVSARDYLAWTDQMTNDFNLIREALKRPYARIEGDYSVPAQIPVPNFVCFRMVSQLLVQRVQSHLLLGNADAAMSDLTLLHGVRRLLEARPDGKPMTLVASMINVAVASLYVGAVADGLRLQVWRDSDLAMIQRQLSEIELPQYVLSSMEFEQASSTKTLENVTAEEFVRIRSGGSPPDPSQQWKDPAYVFLTIAPHGWVYQNMVSMVEMRQLVIDGFDLTNGVIHPDKMDDASKECDALVSSHAPDKLLASILLANFSRAILTLARNQTLANEAEIVCGLERYRMAHNEYPESLEALKPQYAARISHDLVSGKPLKYWRENGKFVLYSVGWNRLDDGGVEGPKTNGPYGTVDYTKGDWAWAYRQSTFK